MESFVLIFGVAIFAVFTRLHLRRVERKIDQVILDHYKLKD